MLILAQQRLVFLEVPKTASTSVRRMLIAASDVPLRGAVYADLPRHLGAMGYYRRLAAGVEADLGGVAETFCVIRAPLERLHSWYRYRQRDKVNGLAASTKAMSFDAFVEGYLAPVVPPYARAGRQDRFVGYASRVARVDHIFDHARLDVLEAFVSERLGRQVRLPQTNVSAGAGSAAVAAPLMARYRESHAAEFELYDKVRAAGVLRRSDA